jgi:hypothetical protein
MVLPGGGPCITGDQQLNKVNSISCLNNGIPHLGKFHIIYHLQHSSIKTMGISKVTNESFTCGDFNNLSNGNYNQIMFSTGCQPATFNYDCIGEHYINNSNGGGVAFIGNSDNGYYGDHVQFGRFVKALYKLGEYNLGIAFQQAPSSNNNTGERRRLHLLGDPEMPVWTATPATLTASASFTGNVQITGERTITVTISGLASGKKANICLQKENECYETRLVTNGVHTFTFIPHTSGAVNITITANNYKPWEWNGYVIVSRNIYISRLTFDDDNADSSIGNGDGQLDAGEKIELTIQLKNSTDISPRGDTSITVATTKASNVVATLSCNSPYITILNNTSNFGTINTGTVKDSPTKYIFEIDSNTPEILINDLDQIKFTLQITAVLDNTNYSFYDEFNIGVFASELELGNQTIVSTSDHDKIIEPGETVTINIDLFNNGKAQATNVRAVLMPNHSPYITSCSATPRTYPSIGKYETKTNSSAYQFIVSPSYIVGQPLNFKLQVVNRYRELLKFNSLKISKIC